MPSVQRATTKRQARRCCAKRAVVLGVFCALAASLLPGRVFAEGFSGYLDLRYSTFDTTSTDPQGNVNKSEATSIGQRYNLMFSRRLAPYLRFYANGLFDKTDNSTVNNGVRTESTETTVVPTLDLTLRSPIYTAGIKYNRRVSSSRSGGSPETTLVSDNYQGILGWTPLELDLPSLQLRVSRQHTYDRDRAFQNVVNDFAGLTVNYAPTNTLQLSYRPSYSASTNRLSGLETELISHSGIAQYSDRFLRDRITIGASYNFNRSERTVSAGGTGVVDISVVPFAGLSSIDDTPLDGALAQTPALIDGNLTASAGINIGLPPIGGDDRDRNIGLDFSFAKEVNVLLLWVDRTLPAVIANSFSWSVYTSTDNLTWNLLTTVFPAAFGTFEDRFEIPVPAVTTRYIKVVVKPLSPTVSGASGFPDILVTELQAFSRKSADEARGSLTSSSDIYSFDARALLLERGPTLYYQFSYLLQKTEPPALEKWTLANSLLAIHRFNRVFSGSASVGWEDYFDSAINGHAYMANATLDAVPLRTLHHTLSYTGRFEKREDGAGSKTNNYYLNNVLHVYAGVVVTASGGLSLRDSDLGEQQKNTNLSASTSVQPHRTVSLNYYVSSITSETTGGEGPGTSSRRTDSSASASYHAFETLYLTASRAVSSDNLKTQRVKTYGLNWSPFLGSSLQFNFAYSESMSNENNTKNRQMGPSMLWRVTRTAALTFSYQDSRSTSDSGSADTKIASADLRATF